MTIPSGKVLAHYEILSPLGAGGMGEVYLARDTLLDRLVAVKFLPVEISSDPQRLRRFTQEAKAASALNHPNIAHIYELGEADGARFIAMEYVEGKPLDQKINRSPLRISEILQIAPQIADALSEAHTKGIIHRDIKASNIVLTNRSQVKVLDFGLAKVVVNNPIPDNDVSTQLKTSPGVVIGTVPYMSPEQALGHDIDYRSDIFSLGVVLYEMATGRLPFSGRTVTETLSRITHDQPEAVSRFNYEVPSELERIIRKCLEKDPARRYQATSELVVDLENLKRDGQSIGLTVPTKDARPAKRLFFIGGFALLVLLAIGIYLFLRSEGTKKDRQTIQTIAVLPFANSNGNQSSEYLSDGITESIINSLSQLPQLRVMARATVFRYKGKEVDPGSIGRELKVDAILTGRVLQQADNLVVQVDLVNVNDGSELWGEHYTRKAVDVFAIQDEIAKQITDRLRLRLSGAEEKLVTKHYTENAEAYDLYLKGRFFWQKGTEESCDKAIEYYRQAIERDPNYTLAYVGVAAAYNTLGGVLGFRAPNATFPKGKEFLAKAVALDETLGNLHAVLASYALEYDWNWPEAERQFKRAIELNPNDSEAHESFGMYLEALGRFDEAISERQLAQKFDPLSPFTVADVGYPYYYARKYDEAITWYRKGLELDPKLSWSHLWIGQAYVQKGMFKEAIDEINQAVQMSGGDIRTRATLAHAYAVAGQRAEALQVLRDLQGLSKERYVSPYYFALISAGLGDNQQTVAWLQKAQEERQAYLVLMHVEPVFDGLHSDPGFIAIERSVGLKH
jgi:serine/threonine-protein kinase